MAEKTGGKDRILGPSASLTIMLLLYGHGKVQFSTLQQLLGLTPGNLNHHLKRLAGAGYIEVSKRFFAGRLVTTISITTQGRSTFKRYVERFKAFLNRVEAEGSRH
jgi:DNA-binding MarR family transcriptional regulator